ncbi:MAG: bacteriohopanetetrol glucosamine biosynthesis glycosyltransferase HpnI [Terriglobia bacterium]
MLAPAHWMLHLREIILVAPFLSFLYYLLAAGCARRFFNRTRTWTPGFNPPISILKPVRGLDREAYENFSSFCRLDYPDYEVLFGVSDPDDPAIPIIQRLIRDFPERPIRLFTGMTKIGPNEKASILAHLSEQARHEVLVISDSDTRVAADCLRALAAPLSDPLVGAVTCLYRGVNERSIADKLEAVGVSSDFFAGVFVAEQFGGARFALGATMAVTRTRLAEIGGFASLSDFLLDDYELGHRIAALGYRVELLPYTVDMVLPAESLRGFWNRQLRWAVGVRNSRPWGHLGLLATQGLPLSLLAVALAGSGRDAVVYLGAYFITRMVMAWVVGVGGLKDSVLRSNWWLVPLRDALASAVWLASFRGGRVHWRGNEFYVRKGRLVPAEVTPSR